MFLQWFIFFCLVNVTFECEFISF